MSAISSTPLPPEAYLSRVEIGLDAIRANYQLLRREVAAGVDMFPVVKADAYGHGAVPVSQILVEEGATRLCVARVEEAVELRKAGIKTSLLVFGPPFLAQARVAAEYGLEAVACDPVHVEAVKRAQEESGAVIPVHLKFDVGMGRIGARPEEAASLYKLCMEYGLTVRGVMSHFPCADAADESITYPMIEKFAEVRAAIEHEGGRDIIYHTSNTAAALRFPDAGFSAVRTGISLYGQYPSLEMPRRWNFSPAMSLKTTVLYIKDVAAGTPISYCQTWKAERASRLATLALGYADGYPRHASSKAHFLVKGRRVPQVGRVCMDQLVIDVTDVPEVIIGDEVLAFGIGEGGVLPVEELAE